MTDKKSNPEGSMIPIPLTPERRFVISEIKCRKCGQVVVAAVIGAYGFVFSYPCVVVACDTVAGTHYLVKRTTEDTTGLHEEARPASQAEVESYIESLPGATLKGVSSRAN